MRIGKLFHLTPLVDDLAAAELFFNSVFSPHCAMRNYSEHWHRHAAIYIIAETSIEPMQPLPPPDGQVGTSWYRYMVQHGPHVHNIAFFVDDLEELGRRLEAAGIRTTDGGTMGSTLFCHPKDTPGMLEFSGSTEMFARIDPRFRSTWNAFQTEYWSNHPLGLQRMSHITVVVDDADAAAKFYESVLDGRRLPEQPSTVGDADAHYVLVGEDTVLELAHPRDGSSVAARELASVGQCVIGATFTVADIGGAAEHLERAQAPIAAVGDHEVVVDRLRTWNTEYRFTDRPLVGDPRVSA